jgi:catechol 2,3-dioxygenase-like lactoylglutathione lyase family enzyme
MQDARLLHSSHCVSDIERCRPFYVDVLGFGVVAKFEFDDPAAARVLGVPGAKHRAIFMTRDGMRIELIVYSVAWSCSERGVRDGSGLA